MKKVFRDFTIFFSKHDLFFKLFAMLLGCIIIPVAIACVSFYLHAADLVRTQTARSNAAYLASLSAQMEVAIDARKSQLIDCSLSETLAKGSFRSTSDQKAAAALLSSTLATHSDLDAIFVIELETNRVVSNNGSFDAEVYFRKFCNFPDLPFEDVYDMLCTGRSFRLYVLNYTRYARTEYAHTSPALLLLYTFVARQPSNAIRVIGCVATPQLAELIVDGSNVERQGEVCILDDSGHSFFSTSEELTALLPEAKGVTFQTCELNGTDYVVQRLAASNGLHYVNVIPETVYNAGLLSIRSFTLLLSSRISQPIVHLSNSFSDGVRSGQASTPIENTTVYRSIYSNINQIRSSNERLSTLMQHGQHQLRSTMLLDILRGRQHDARFLSYQLSELNAQFPYDYYTVVLLSFDFYKRAYLDYTPVELAHMQDGICKLTTTWQYPFRQKTEFVECAPRTFAFIINTDTLNIEPLCRELEQILRLADIENDQLRLIFVATAFVQRLEDLPELYLRAQNALRYRVLNRQSQLIRSDHLPLAERTSVLLTSENKTFITNYITSGNSDAAKNYICAIVERSAESGIPYEHLITAFSSILALIAQILADRGVAFFQMFEIDPFVELNSLNSLDEICDFFRSVCTKADAAIMNRQQQESDVLHRSMEYIAQNYRSRISLDDVSAFVGYSPKYFSRYFKDQTGITFVNYLNRLRIQAAKEMLCEETITIKDIASQVGFESVNTFFRVFKQFEGVTPGQYRASLIGGDAVSQE